MNLLYLLGPAVTLLALFACTPDQLADAEPLERALLITWVALERGNVEVAATYNSKAQKHWSALREHTQSFVLTNNQRDNLLLFSTRMARLDFAVNHQQDATARTTLFQIQHQLQSIPQWRDRDHPANQLYHFYLDWEEVRQASHDQKMCLLEWREFEELYEVAEQKWSAYQSDPSRYHYEGIFPGLRSSGQQAEAQALALNQALAEFAVLLRQGNHTLTAAPSEGVHRLFLDYLAVSLAYPAAQALK